MLTVMERRCIYKAARSARSFNSSKSEKDLKEKMSQKQGHYKKQTLPLPAGNWGVRESRNAFPGVKTPGSRLVFEAAASRGKEREGERERSLGRSKR